MSECIMHCDDEDDDAIWLAYDMVTSPAWRSLSPARVGIYLELAVQYDGDNNGDLSLSLGEGARLPHLSKSTVKRALDELEAKGFICKTGVGHGRRAATYRLTEEPYNGEPATRDWQSWRPMEQRQ